MNAIFDRANVKTEPAADAILFPDNDGRARGDCFKLPVGALIVSGRGTSHTVFVEQVDALVG
jgi:hypothetical protein